MQMNLDAAQGQRLKREGQEQVESKNWAFLNKMRWYAQTHAQRWGSVTSDDVRRYATSLGLYPTHHNCWAGVFRCPGWVCIGRQPSKLPSNHARWINVYRWEGLDSAGKKV